MLIPTRVALVLVLFANTASADDSCKTDKPTTITKQAKKPVAPPTPKLSFAAGAYRDSRDLLIAAENVEGVTQYAGVPHNGIALDGAIYPVEFKSGRLSSSLGLSLAAAHSVRGSVTFDDGESVGDMSIQQSAWNVGGHYRLAVGRVAIDNELAYGQQRYRIEDAPMSFEVPDTAYAYVSAGTHVDINVYRGVTLGAGARYMQGSGGGDMTTQDWYGAGTISGHGFDATVLVPLPQHLFVRAKLARSSMTTKFSGVGNITEEEGVTSATDAATTMGLSVGVQY